MCLKIYNYSVQHIFQDAVSTNTADIGSSASHLLQSSTSDAQAETSSSVTVTPQSSTLIKNEWKKGIALCDHQWIGSEMFRPSQKTKGTTKSGEVRGMELKDGENLKLWYHPPSASTGGSSPKLAWYFGKRLMCWMPLSMWRIRFQCPACGDSMQRNTTYEVVRKVLDVTDYFYLVTEVLQCSNRKKKDAQGNTEGCGFRCPAWNKEIINQLDAGHRAEFPIILTSM